MSTDKITHENLSQFTGSQQLFFNPMFGAYKYTEGIQFLNANGAGWLVDMILSNLVYNSAVRKGDFVSITLTVKDPINPRQKGSKWKEATVKFTDGDDTILYVEEIPMTDFPLVGDFLFFATDGVLMIASEY